MTMTIGTECFAYYKSEKVFTTCISDLGLPYPPASILLVSEWTGKKMLFKYSRTHNDSEGDIAYWEFTQGSDCTLSDISIRIFND